MVAGGIIRTTRSMLGPNISVKPEKKIFDKRKKTLFWNAKGVLSKFSNEEIFFLK